MVEFGTFYKTKAGTPQGGIISPLLANIALNGLERLFGSENGKGKYVSPCQRRNKNQGISLIRYADDFEVTAPSRSIIINHILPSLRKFLKQRGMVLNKAKTKIIHRTQGFDFLGFHIRQFQGTSTTVCLTQPSNEAVKRHLKKLKEIISTNKQATVEDLISKLNPIIRGWAYYYRYCSAKRTFNYIEKGTFRS